MRHTREDLAKLTVDELVDKCTEQDAYIESLLSKISSRGDEGGTSRETEDKLKQQQQEAARRENVLYMKLTSKEQELQECMKQIQELQQVQIPTAERLRTMLLDPAVSLLFRRMKKEIESLREKLDQAQNDLAACKFTPDSQTGKRLMAKCRMLLQENEELGKVISTGRTARLEGEIALQKKLAQEMKKTQSDTEEFLSELDEEVEGMQSAIYMLQQQLREAHDQSTQLQTENAQLKSMLADLTSKSNAISQDNVVNSGHTSMDISNCNDSSADKNTTDNNQPSMTVDLSVNSKLLDPIVVKTESTSLTANQRTSNAVSLTNDDNTARSKFNSEDGLHTWVGHSKGQDENGDIKKTDERNGEIRKTKEPKDCTGVKNDTEKDDDYRTKESVDELSSHERFSKSEDLRSKDGKISLESSRTDSVCLTDDIRNKEQHDRHHKMDILTNRDLQDDRSNDKSVISSQPTVKSSERKHHKSRDSNEKKRRTKEEFLENDDQQADQNKLRSGKDADDGQHRKEGHRTKRNKKDSNEGQHKRRKLSRTGSKSEDMPNGVMGLGNGDSSNDNM